MEDLGSRDEASAKTIAPDSIHTTANDTSKENISPPISKSTIENMTVEDYKAHYI